MVSGPLQPLMARATALLERGHGADAASLLAPVLRGGLSRREDELAVRCLLAEAALLAGDLAQAVVALGRTPDALRDALPPLLLCTLWRLHGRVAFARGEQSRAIALHGRALKQADIAHDSRAIGLVHYELGLCYKQVGDAAIVREHLAEAAAALHAAGDRRHLALVHSLSGIMLAQTGRYDEATSALKHAERLAAALGADDVLAIVCGNQAGIALIRQRTDQALALAERAVNLHEATAPSQGLAPALATLGQICVRMGLLARADAVLHRALDARTTIRFHETSGGVYDTLSQIALLRGDYALAAGHLQRAADAYGAYGQHTAKWYEWSVRVITARLAVRRGVPEEALASAEAIVTSGAAPPAEALDAELIAAEALLALGRTAETEQRLASVEPRLSARSMPGAWGEFLRLRGLLRGHQGRLTEAHHDISQSTSVFDLIGAHHQRGVSHLALARLSASAGLRSAAHRHFTAAREAFEALGATRDLEETRRAMAAPPLPVTTEYVGSPADADDALVRRLVDASVLPQLLARELAAALLEAVSADLSTVFVELPGGDSRPVAWSGTDADGARRTARLAREGAACGAGSLWCEPLGRDADGPRFLAVAAGRAFGDHELRRLRMMAAVARQGFELCGAREREGSAPEPPGERPIEPLVAGFVCASAAMHKVVEQIQRLQGNDLTVLVTGESGTGKELIAQAIHAGSLRSAATFLPYNCTTTTRDLADSQLFGHRRGAFTGAVGDQPGLVRAASGGTLFLDEVGDLPLDVQPKLLRFLEQGEIMPLGETRPLTVDVRTIAATNADLEQRVAEGRFREDLYYRLSVIRIHVPPLRQRREEVPHLSTYFLREACERLGRPDVQLGADVLDLFAQYWWPGNVRQLRNEIQRAVALTSAGGTVGAGQLSPDLTSERPRTDERAGGDARRLRGGSTLASLVDDLERDVIREGLSTHRGNISETARALGLTRRGLYLKLRRLGLEPVGQD